MTKTLELVLVSMMVLAVLAFGGTESISYAVAEVVLFVSVLFLIVTRGASLPPGILPLLSIPLGLIGIVLLQLLPLPGSVISWLGGRAEPLPGRSYSSISIAPSETTSHFLLLLTSLAAFCLTLTVGRRSGARRRIVYALLAIGSFEALFGLFQYLTDWQQIFNYKNIYGLKVASGTYISKNHFAGLLEMVLPFALALSLSQLGSVGELGQPAALRMRRLLLRTELSKFLLCLSVAAVLLLALFFSFSRMGILASLCSMLWIFGITANFWLPRRVGVALAILFAFVGGSLVTWVGPGPVITRFSELEKETAFTGESRLAVWRDTFELIGRHPWLGSGLGTFPIAYTSVQTVFLNKFVNHAHNDYLELTSDLGIPAGCILFGSILYLPVRTVRRLRGIQGSFDRAIALGSTGSIVAILLHSLADFNLYVPANSMIFCVILGLSLTAGSPERGQGGTVQ